MRCFACIFLRMVSKYYTQYKAIRCLIIQKSKYCKCPWWKYWRTRGARGDLKMWHTQLYHLAFSCAGSSSGTRSFSQRICRYAHQKMQ